MLMQNKIRPNLKSQSYNRLFLIILIGLAVSFAGFIIALNFYNKDFEGDFIHFAKIQTGLLIKALEARHIKMKLIEQLYYASQKSDSNEDYEEIITSIDMETTFDSFLVFKSTQQSDYEVTYFAGRLGLGAFSNNLSFIKTQINQNQSWGATSPFSISGRSDKYVAFTLLMKRKEKNQHQILMGLLNLDSLFKTRAGLLVNSKLIKAYVYDTDNLDVPFYTLPKPTTQQHLQLNQNINSLSLYKLKKNSYAFYEQQITLGGKSWIILLIPNQHYILASYVVFPWTILASGLIIVSLLGYYSFRLTTTINNLEAESASLVESKLFIQNIINYAVDGLIIIDSNGTIESFNPTCEKIFGYSAERILNKNIMFLIPELNRRELNKYLSNLESDESSTTITKRKELEGKRQDKTTFPLDILFSKVKMNERIIFNGTIRDITDRKEAEELKEKLIHKLTESNIELEQFAYVASHDLQEPLRTITNYTSLITTIYKDSLDSELYKYIAICTSAAKRMHELVSDLLEYASLSQHSTRFYLVDCNEVVERVISNLSIHIKERKAQVKYGVLPKVLGNNILLISLFQNLISNGLKYQPENHIPKITITSREDGEYYLISISDNGLGIEKKYLERIFIPFKRLHTKHEFPGSGIGLAMCKRIVNKCKGKIWVESTLGKGSTFHFTLLKGTLKEEG